MSDDRERAFERCVGAFASGDYASCVQEGLPLLAAGATLQLLQLVLISLQRSGQEEQAERFGAQSLAFTAGHPWYNALLGITTGRLDPAEVVRSVGGDEQRCQALFYAAMRLLTLGQAALARFALAEAAAIGAPSMECALARMAQAGPASPGGWSVPSQPSGGAAERVAERVEAWNQQVVQLHQQGRYREAIALATQARDLARQSVGEGHPSYAASLNNLAGLHQEMGDYAAAEPLYRQAVEITKANLGEEHPDYAVRLNNLAELYRAKGDHAAAEPLHRRAAEIKKATLGEGHPSYALSLNNLAEVYRIKGDYAAAESLHRRAAEIRKAALGEDHPDYGMSLNNLAGLYQGMGDYAAAEELYRRAVEVDERALGPDHPAIATDLNNLAELYRAKGDYAAAEPLYRRASEIMRAALGEGHPSYAVSLNNLAGLYRARGDRAAAQPLYERAAVIMRAAVGTEHPEYATILNDLAGLYQNEGDYAAAEPLHRRAAEITKAALGEGHPSYAATLNNLAGLYLRTGDYAAAEPLYRRAAETMRAALGDGHPDYAAGLNNLAELHMSRGDYASAEPLYRRAAEIAKAALGEQHPDYATSLNNLALLAAATGRPGEALAQMRQAAGIADRMIGQVFASGSEVQRMAFLANLRGQVNAFLSLVLREFAGDAAAARAALDLVLRRKGIGAEALAAQRDAVLGGRYPELGPRLRELAGLRARIAHKTLAGPGPEGRAAHERALGQWSAERDRLEADLARQVPEVGLEQKLRSADRRAIALALPSGSALVEFVRFDEFDFRAVSARGEKEWKPARYAAFVLHAGRPDDVRVADLGEAEPIDRMIQAFREQIIREGGRRRDMGIDPDEPIAPADPGPADGAGGVPPPGADGRELFAAVFAPVRAALDGAARLLLAPDGDLSRLPFEVLPCAEGRVIDAWRIGYLATGRDVLRLAAPASGRHSQPVVAADPDFDLAGIARITPGPAEGAGAGKLSRDLDRGQPGQSGQPGRPRFHFGRLPGTEQEGREVAGMLGVRPWLGEAALESRLKACRSPRVLHLATHGFFLKDQRRDTEQGGRLGRLAGPLPENPLLRSGLGLAGVNTWLRGGAPPEEAEDGVLTADDVAGMDLLDTELVVLSACETGLGEVKVGEGVFGLRRSFALAGARTLVMSLWKVPDEQTRELMVDFYRRLLAGAPRSDALREAQLALRARHPHPYYWGAFICQGDPGPLGA